MSSATRSANKSSGRAARGSDEPEGFLPKAQQLSAQAFADGTKVMQDASSFVRTVHQISEEAHASLEDSMSHRPYLMLGAAAATGFVLGRGLTLGMSRTLLGVGGRLAMNMIVKRVTQGLV
jgi:ElaB/YqjD/DUF883 family membrane-anchored ribosome-binding protein